MLKQPKENIPFFLFEESAYLGTQGDTVHPPWIFSYKSCSVKSAQDYNRKKMTLKINRCGTYRLWLEEFL